MSDFPPFCATKEYTKVSLWDLKS